MGEKGIDSAEKMRAPALEDRRTDSEMAETKGVLDNCPKARPAFVEHALDEEVDRVKREIGAAAYARGRFPEAIGLFCEISLAPDFGESLIIPAYKLMD